MLREYVVGWQGIVPAPELAEAAAYKVPARFLKTGRTIQKLAVL